MKMLSILSELFFGIAGVIMAFMCVVYILWIGGIPLPIALVLAVVAVLFALLAFATYHDKKALEEKYKDI